MAQEAAIGTGRLAVVQPLLVTSVAVARPLAVWLSGSAAADCRAGPIEADHLGDQSLVGPKHVGGNASGRSAVISSDPPPDYHLNMRDPGRPGPGLGIGLRPTS